MKTVDELMGKTRPNKAIELSTVKEDAGEIVIDPNSSAYPDADSELGNRRVIDTSKPGMKPAMRQQQQQAVSAGSRATSRRIVEAPVVAKPTQTEPVAKSIEEKSMNILEAGINRKINEYHEEMTRLQEKSDELEYLVDNGLETVEGELKYNPFDERNDPDHPDALDEVEQDIENGDFGFYEDPDDSVVTNVYVAEPSTLLKYVDDQDTSVADYGDDETVFSEDEDPDVEEDDDTNLTRDHVDEKENDYIQSQEDVLFSNITKRNVTNVDVTKIKPADIDPNDFADLEDFDQAEEDAKADREEEEKLLKAARSSIRSEILTKIVNVAKRFDASTMKITNKPISINRALKLAQKKDGAPVERTATWALLNANRPYISTSLTGPEVAILNQYDEGTNSYYISNEQQLRIIYRHDANPYKPNTFEAWTKTIPYSDIEEIYAAVYAATFDSGNFMPYSCKNKKCAHMWLSDHIKIKELAKFADDKTKEKFDRIMKMPLTAEASVATESVIAPINEVYAVGLKLPSIYNMLLELRSVDTSFVDKYIEIITAILYIDAIYVVDDGNLSKIQWKEYPGDIAKTFKSKIATYSKILNSISSDDFDVLSAYINSLSEIEHPIRYMIPEAHCPKCNELVAESEIGAKYAVFTRVQLVELLTTLTE